MTAATLDCVHGCRTQDEHDEGEALQAKHRAMFDIPADDCVGCYLGDDGPSIHDMSYGCAYGKGASI